MKPITESSAKRRAMALGGKLELPTGKVFNAARAASSTAPTKPPEKPPAIESPAKAIKPDDGALSSAAIEKMAAAVFTLADQNAVVIHAIKKKLESTPAPVKPVRHWTFKVNRDAAGNMTTIDAIAKE